VFIAALLPQPEVVRAQVACAPAPDAKQGRNTAGRPASERGTVAMLATDLLRWFALLCLPAALRDTEPKTLRYRLLHTAARIVRGQRKRKIKIPEVWPWAHELAAAFVRAFALTPT